MNFLRTVAVVVIGMATLGCGSASDGASRATVFGKVTIDGTAVAEGTIEFEPTGTTKGPKSFGQIVSGAYKMEEANRGPVVGTHKVRINWIKKTGEKDATGADVFVEAIPAKYHSATTLEIAVKAGKNEHDFTLTSQ